MKLNIELYLKVDFVGPGWVYRRVEAGNFFQNPPTGVTIQPSSGPWHVRGTNELKYAKRTEIQKFTTSTQREPPPRKGNREES